MKILDITFDLETCSLCPTAAVMSIGAVAWDRNGEGSPFIYDEKGSDYNSQYNVHIDMRRMIVDAFTIDPDTQNWWSQQSNEAKEAVLDSDECAPCTDIIDAIRDVFSWINDLKEENGYDTVNLWCQGSDFDIAILRNICYKYKINIPVKYTNFRDHRTFFMEGARMICEMDGTEFDPKKAYSLVEDYDGKGAPHDPVFDCKRSIYSTWQMMQMLRGLLQHNKQ